MEATDRLSAADEKWGYHFGCDGVVGMAKAMYLADKQRDSINDWIKEGKIRRGFDNGRIKICRRSLMEHIRTLETTEEPV